jgi:hypothetical protein
MIRPSLKACLFSCLLAAALTAAAQAQSNAVGEAYPSTLWPQVAGVATVYYYIEPVSGDSANLTTALDTFNADFPGIIQWVQLSSVSPSSPNYVDINLDAGDYSGQCEANEGYEAVQGQPMGGSGACTVTTLLHEMGHVVGLWHEQSRSDRATYVTVNYANVIKGSWGNFEIVTDNQQLLTPYDYASVMQYPSTTLSRNGGPVIESIPAGIPLQGTDGIPAGLYAPDYSAADKEAVQRLYGAAPTQVTVTSNPIGLQIKVDGATVTTPQTYTWALNSTHTLSVASGVQTLTGDIANSDPPVSATFYYKYGRWNDSAAQTHTITIAPGNGSPAFPSTSPQVATYSANFVQLVPYTSSVYPSGEGTVSVSPAPLTYTGATGTFFLARQKVTLTATPSSGWSFYEFNNGPFWLPGGLGLNPKPFFVPDTGNPVDPTAEFSNTPVFTFALTPDPFASNLYVLIDNNFWYAPKNFSSFYDSYTGDDWSFGTQHSIAIDSLESPYSFNSRRAFSKWSDSGAISHTITVPAASATYTATVTPQFAPATNFSFPPCGGTASIAPASPTGDGFYDTGTSLQFSATPDSGWTFAGWTYDLTGAVNPASLTASDETLVYANFNTTSAPLTLTSLAPAAARAGMSTFTLTLTGTGFTPQSLVVVNGQYPTVSYVSPTELQVTVPASDVAAPAAFQVYVENFPSGWDGCAVFGFQTFIVEGPAATPPITWHNPAAITYGAALSSTQLNATSTVAGTFAYTPAAGTILPAGTQTLSVTFTPTDTTDYTTASATVSITVKKATPVITWATPAPITYGTTVSATQEDATASAPGVITYSQPIGWRPKAGPHSLAAYCTPTDTADYYNATATITLTVNQATPTITWKTPASIKYGTALSATQLNATASVAGTFAYSPAAGTVLTAGAQTLSVTFTPTDATDYTAPTATTTLTVAKVMPVITWPTPAPITYPTPVSATQENATANVPGSFRYSQPIGWVPKPGTHPLAAYFTPTDTTDYYTSATDTITLTVN